MNPESPQPGSEQDQNSGQQLAQELNQIQAEQAQDKPAEPTKDGRFRRWTRNALIAAGIGGALGGAELATHQQEKPDKAPTPSTSPVTPEQTEAPPFLNQFAAERAKPFKIGEIDNIIKVGNFETLKQHQLQVVDRLASSEKSTFTAISMDGEKPPVDLNDFAFGNQVANEVAGSGISINYQYTQGNEVKNATFQVKARTPENTYVIFVPESTDLSKYEPSTGQGAEAFTHCSENACVTMLKNAQHTPEGAEPATGISTNRINAFTAAMQSSFEVTGGQDAAENAIGFNAFTKGVGTALTNIESGQDYEAYSSYVSVPPGGEQAQPPIYKVDQQTYKQMSDQLYK